MASSYVNNLRLNEMATGDASGTWGTITNTNLELIGEALGFGTEAITTNADTHTSTIADGASDGGSANDGARAMYLKYTGTLDSTCTITIAPNDIRRMQFIENGTSGGQSIIISQGSGANVTIPNGDTKAVYLDGAGSGAAVVDAFASLNVVDLKVQDDLTVNDDLFLNSDSAVLNIGAGNDFQITHTGSAGTITNGTGDLTLDVEGNIKLDANGGDVRLLDNGTQFGLLQNSSSDFVIQSSVSDKNILLKGNDDSSGITALTLDMSDAGKAHFNAGAAFAKDVTITTGDNSAQLILVCTDTDASTGPKLELNRNPGEAGADGDNLGQIEFYGYNDASQKSQYAYIFAEAADVADGSEDVRFGIGGLVAGADTSLMTFAHGTSATGADPEMVFNQDSKDINFRVESNSHANMFLVDAGEDIVSLVGGGSRTVGSFKNTLQIEGTTGQTSSMSITRNTAGTSPPYLQFAKTRGSAAGENNIVQSGDTLGIITWSGADGTNLDTNGAIIMAQVDGTPGENDMPGRLVFSTTADGAASTTERMRIDKDGNVGIGQSSPAVELHVQGNSRFGNSNGIAASGNADSVVIENSGTAGVSILSGSTSPGNIFFGDSGDNDIGAIQYNHNGNTLAFNVNASERMRIDSSGRLFRGSTTDLTGICQSFFKNINSGEGGIGIGNNDGSIATNAMIFRNSNGNIGSIQTIGSGTAFNTSSDYRLKENVSYDFDATTQVKQLKPCEFNFKADVDTKITGFLAHEAQAVVPNAISGEKDAVDKNGNAIHQQIDPTKMIGLLVKTIQELEARITALEGA
jgi:hypothetical protein